MELKQNNMTSNYFSEEYLMNTVSRFWKKQASKGVSKPTGHRSGRGCMY